MNGHRHTNEDEIRSVEGLGRSARNGFVDASRGGPEGTAPSRFTRQVAVYDPLLIVAMAASAARRDLDLNQLASVGKSTPWIPA